RRGALARRRARVDERQPVPLRCLRADRARRGAGGAGPGRAPQRARPRAHRHRHGTRMNAFDYHRANDADAALAQMAGPLAGSGAFIAGGTNLLDLMKENVARPARLVDINALPLDGIDVAPDGSVRLGALARN